MPPKEKAKVAPSEADGDDEDEDDEDDDEDDDDESDSHPAWYSVKRQRPQRKIMKRVEYSDGDDEFYGQELWQDDASDVSYSCSSSEEREVLQESIHSDWTSGSTSEPDADSESSKEGKKPAPKKAVRIKPAEAGLPTRHTLEERKHLTFSKEALLSPSFGWVLGSTASNPPWRPVSAQPAEVTSVTRHSAAEKGGLEGGMVVVYVNGAAVFWAEQVFGAIRKAEGKTVTITVTIPEDESSEDESESGGDEESEEVEGTPSSARGLGKGKGRGPQQDGSVSPSHGMGNGQSATASPAKPTAKAAVKAATKAAVKAAVKPAAKRSLPQIAECGQSRTQSPIDSAQWQEARLKLAHERARNAPNILAEILQKAKAQQEQRHEAMLAKRKKKHMGETLLVRSTGKEGLPRSLFSWTDAWSAPRFRPPAAPQPLAGISAQHGVVTKGTWRYRDHVTQLGFNTLDDHRLLQRSKELVERWWKEEEGEDPLPRDILSRFLCIAAGEITKTSAPGKRTRDDETVSPAKEQGRKRRRPESRKKV